MIPLATTTITVKVLASGDDPYNDAAVSVLATGVRAHFGHPSGSERLVGGQEEKVDMVLSCDPVVGLSHYCRVTDDSTAETWDVLWVRKRTGLGLDHQRAGLQAVSGGSGG